jgi:LPXTG-motif cell wall-anchored protein
MKLPNKMRFIPFLLTPLLVMLVVMMTVPSMLMAEATAPDLGAASSFSVLAALSMSAADPGTTICGDLGLSPGLASSKTGNWTVGGSEYFGTGGLSADAQSAALGAFNNLAGQTSNGGWGTSPWSPPPGVWTATGSPVFTGTITLNGGYNDVWVFQISTDFTFSGSVVLEGNVQACHVFWQVARDATIAKDSSFSGTLIASRDVNLVSGATVNGRIISLNGALTTDGNTISCPTCKSAPKHKVYTITSSVEGNGSITDLGSVDISAGKEKIYTITPSEGYSIADVLVNGVSVGAVTSYNFSDVNSDQTIHVIFSEIVTEEVTEETTMTTTTPVTSTVTGGQLPKTSTPWYNILIAGIALILIGAVAWWITRKKIHV